MLARLRRTRTDIEQRECVHVYVHSTFQSRQLSLISVAVVPWLHPTLLSHQLSFVSSGLVSSIGWSPPTDRSVAPSFMGRALEPSLNPSHHCVSSVKSPRLVGSTDESETFHQNAFKTWRLAASIRTFHPCVLSALVSEAFISSDLFRDRGLIGVAPKGTAQNFLIEIVPDPGETLISPQSMI
ncbi:hypothetical protein KQX54_005560 [Cotesia glomerata]|uniref:Uncharacterized protein n=1 Tax=Cotesia glomerata TaxID=32391 RepID=A0AAV7HCZ2_COTGL|nr:hypothetical protein KQX54_005560 [Cotesia glomerata]